MSASKFTPEEIRLLKEHPYIIEVTPGKVCFSKEFKEIIEQIEKAEKEANKDKNGGTWGNPFD